MHNTISTYVVCKSLIDHRNYGLYLPHHILPMVVMTMDIIYMYYQMICRHLGIASLNRNQM